jgi:hypothetical protein
MLRLSRQLMPESRLRCEAVAFLVGRSRMGQTEDPTELPTLRILIEYTALQGRRLRQWLNHAQDGGKQTLHVSEDIPFQLIPSKTTSSN